MNTVDRSVPAVAERGIADRIAVWCATVAGIGYIPIGRGTAVMVPFLFFIPAFTGLAPLARIAMVIAAVLAAVAVSQRAEKVFGVHDDHRIVLDEAVSLFVTFATVPQVGLFSPFLAAGFLLNRIFDWTKPFPVSRLQNLPGGWGIVIDDVASGAMAGVVVHVAMAFFGK